MNPTQQTIRVTHATETHAYGRSNKGHPIRYRFHDRFTANSVLHHLHYSPPGEPLTLNCQAATIQAQHHARTNAPEPTP